MVMPSSDVKWFDGLFGGITKRLDWTNALLARLIELQGGTLPTFVVSPPSQQSGAVSSAPANRESFLTGQVTVVTAGIAVQLSSSSIPIPNGFQITVIAKPGNVGTVYVGRTKGDAEGSQKFDGLGPGLAVSLKIKNVNSVWVNGDTNGDAVSWVVEQ